MVDWVFKKSVLRGVSNSDSKSVHMCQSVKKSLPALGNKLLLFLYKLDFWQLLKRKGPRNLTAVFSYLEPFTS